MKGGGEHWIGWMRGAGESRGEGNEGSRERTEVRKKVGEGGGGGE